MVKDYPVLISFFIPRQKGGGGYGNSLRLSFRHSICLSFRPTFLSGAYLQKYLRYQLQTSQVDRSHLGGVQYTRTTTLSSVFLELLPFVHFLSWNFCSEHISKSMKARNLKLHTHIELMEEACSAQHPLLCLQYFWSYCPLYIFTLNFCPEHISKSIKARNLKLHTYLEHVEEKCSEQP